MPQRFLKPGIRDSEKWNSCDWQSQSFYIRLLTLVDDFGRFDGHPSLLRGHAFALREEITSEIISQLCESLARAGLANFYEKDGKRFVELTNWTERARASESKYPKFDNTCKHLFADVSKCSPPSFLVPRSSPSPSPSEVGVYEKQEAFKEITDTYHRKAITVLMFLNDAAKVDYRQNSANLDPISDRLNEQGVTVDGVLRMIERMVKSWTGTKQQDWLRPATLFDREKFQSYYANREKPIQHENNKGTNDGGIDRNKGTHNEGKAHLYANAGRRADVQNVRRPSP